MESVAIENSPVVGLGQAQLQSSLATGTIEEQLNAMLSAPDESFSVAAYLNLALRSGPSATTLGATTTNQQDATSNEEDFQQQRMAELALQLQLQTQSCHEEIGKIGAEVQAILPRCQADVGRIGVGLEGLQQDAVVLLQQASAGSQQAEQQSSSLETLSTLHALQANLKRTHEILTAAATWDSTLEELRPLLVPGTAGSSTSNLPLAVKKLALLEQGAKALSGMPNPEEREAVVAKLRMQISALLQPQLQHALQNMATRLGPLQQCVSLYGQLEMLDQLQLEYIRVRPKDLHRTWFEFRGNTKTVGGPGAEVVEPTSDTSFAEWLPTWLDSVWQLLQEERRQVSTVFGPAKVPTVTALVLQEAFRPILPSWKNRLQAIIASPPGSPVVDLSLFCGLYQQTLQFLSLAYESLAGAWLDLVEAGQVLPELDGLTLHPKITELLSDVAASSFGEYQKKWHQSEQQNAQVRFELWGQELSQVSQRLSGPAGLDLDALTSETENMVESTKQLLPAATEALDRLELLQGGFNTATWVEAIDQACLSRFISKLAESLLQLANALLKPSGGASVGSVQSLDEPHVLAALSVLPIAGTLDIQLRSFEEQMRKRLIVLGERCNGHETRLKEVQEVQDKVNKDKSSMVTPQARVTAFMLPDSWSPVEINSMITLSFSNAGTAGPESSSTMAVLKRLTALPTMLPQSEQACRRLTSACHTFVFNVCAAVPFQHLQGMSALTTWREPAAQDDFSYGTLPQPYITHVGEHMLALVQALEPFAADKEGLRLANQVMDQIRQVTVQPWLDFLAACGIGDEIGTISTVTPTFALPLMDGKEILDLLVGDVLLVDDEGVDEDEDEGGQDKETAAFCNAWLDVVGLAVTGRLLERILRIPSLTSKGCEHLQADLNYLINVFTALGVTGHPHPLLGHVAEIVMVEPSVLSERIQQFNRQDPQQSALRAMEERILAMRGA